MHNKNETQRTVAKCGETDPVFLNGSLSFYGIKREIFIEGYSLSFYKYFKEKKRSKAVIVDVQPDIVALRNSWKRVIQDRAQLYVVVDARRNLECWRKTEKDALYVLDDVF